MNLRIAFQFKWVNPRTNRSEVLGTLLEQVIESNELEVNFEFPSGLIPMLPFLKPQLRVLEYSEPHAMNLVTARVRHYEDTEMQVEGRGRFRVEQPSGGWYSIHPLSSSVREWLIERVMDSPLIVFGCKGNEYGVVPVHASGMFFERMVNVEHFERVGEL